MSGFTFYWKLLKSVLSSFTMLSDVQRFLQLQCTANRVIFKSPFSTLIWPMREREKYIYLGLKYSKWYQIVISFAHSSRIIFLRSHQISFRPQVRILFRFWAAQFYTSSVKTPEKRNISISLLKLWKKPTIKI